MKLHRLTLTNYRGVAHREVEFPERGVVVINGANADGGALTIFADSNESAKAVDAKPDQADAPGEQSEIDKNREKP